ncbi:thiol-disulfide oxidoreductase DCC family protein [Metasolibacillus fluoroglycofenilyticus]|uniref:thiol-disulfide oxidoreductase DCC family protein n=1 Tax=Metasolibacillus fluoroglycofenilyticus TaxID=1239396 RepID=UPI000D359FB4|nr:thiol-disulfide oxidoreductase DCC family protein [Metasolibacillus fluoroglycofenilyticus]
MAIVLFDGECHFCDASVQFIIKRDPKGYFQFASLQSEVGRELLERYQVPKADSIVLIENGRYFLQSTAALKIARRLQGFWRFAYVFIAVPTGVRNFAYNKLAKNRYKWFGKKELCELPSQDIRQRFLS